MGRFEDRFERFEDKVDARFDKVDARFDKVDERFREMATKQDLTGIEERLDRMDSRFDMWGRTVVGAVLSIAGAAIYKILGF